MHISDSVDQGYVLDSLRRLEHLSVMADLLNAGHSQELASRLRDWLITCLELEHVRRDSSDEPTYPLVNLDTFSAYELNGSCILTLTVFKTATDIGDPTLCEFSYRLHQLIIAEMACRLERQPS